jgi:hypothetical protein
LRPAHAGGSGPADRSGGCPRADSPPLPDGRLAGLPRGTAPSGRGGVSAPAAWARGAHPPTAFGGTARPVLRARGASAGPDGPGRGGPPARGLRWATPVWPAVASAPARRDDPDRLDGTLGWHLAWACGAPAAPHPLCVWDCHPSVAYLLATDIFSGLLPIHLREVHQPVMITRNRCLRPRPRLLTCL